ncbi:hypothetical protein [Burkholderia stagnalis]
MELLTDDEINSVSAGNGVVQAAVIGWFVSKGLDAAHDMIRFAIDWISRNKMEVNDITIYNAMGDFNNQGNDADGQ